MPTGSTTPTAADLPIRSTKLPDPLPTPGDVVLVRLSSVRRPCMVVTCNPRGYVSGWIFGARDDYVEDAFRENVDGRFGAMTVYGVLRADAIPYGSGPGEWLLKEA